MYTKQKIWSRGTTYNRGYVVSILGGLYDLTQSLGIISPSSIHLSVTFIISTFLHSWVAPRLWNKISLSIHQLTEHQERNGRKNIIGRTAGKCCPCHVTWFMHMCAHSCGYHTRPNQLNVPPKGGKGAFKASPLDKMLWILNGYWGRKGTLLWRSSHWKIAEDSVVHPTIITIWAMLIGFNESYIKERGRTWGWDVLEADILEGERKVTMIKLHCTYIYMWNLQEMK